MILNLNQIKKLKKIKFGFEPKKIPKYEHGGMITGGVGHDEYNQIGDKGIPMISLASYNTHKGYNVRDKEAEIESKELIFNSETSRDINKLVNKYLDCKCPDVLVELGKLVHYSLRNVSDETCRTSCEFKPKLQNL